MKLSIVPYDKDRDGEQVGILWVDGLIESIKPLYVETMLHPKLLLAVGSIEILLFYGIETPTPLLWPLKFLPIIAFLSISILIWLVGLALKFHARWTRTRRIESTFTSSEDRTGQKTKKTILGQWVLRDVSSDSNQQERQQRYDSSSPSVLGCVSLYREEDHHDNGERVGPTVTESTRILNQMDDKGGTTVWIAHATVDKRVRSLGWGHKLIARAESEARKLGAKKIRILSGNIQTKPFWIRRGYKLLKTKWRLLGHESVYMELDLTSTTRATTTISKES